jgi:hypothetical protein
MRLPNVEMAIVEERKLSGYLLAFDHPEGAGKADFFHRAGFTVTNLVTFKDALIHHASVNDVKDVVLTAHGTKYVVEGPFPCPAGKDSAIRSIWIVDKGFERPRLVSAYPL